ncbi:hypothetical protein BaRGS_00019333, partial [Batillaria attramentaria]
SRQGPTCLFQYAAHPKPCSRPNGFNALSFWVTFVQCSRVIPARQERAQGYPARKSTS